jgi:type II secretory pathway component PulK
MGKGMFTERGETTAANGVKGLILVMVLWVATVLAVVLLTFALMARVEVKTSAHYGDRLRAVEIAKSGIERGMAELRLDETTDDSLRDSWAEDEGIFREIPLSGGTFWLFRPDFENPDEVRYGIRDEASKINLNTANRDMLLQIPGLDEEQVDAILDWRDEDDNPREQGAESEYYLTLDPPYNAKNAAFETLEELLLVRGITREVLYGEDTNRNGILDAAERDGDDNPPPDNADGVLNRGIIDFLTLHSYNKNETAEGEQKKNVSQISPQEFRSALEGKIDNWKVELLVQYMQRRRQLASVADFLNVGAVEREDFKVLDDQFTTTDDEEIKGLINVNTAPKEVLLALPEMDEELVDGLLGYRQDEAKDISSVAWLMEVMERQTLQKLYPYITVRSFQFRVDAVGRIEGKTVFRRIAAVVDRAKDPYVIIQWKDLTHLGYPFPQEEKRLQ